MFMALLDCHVSFRASAALTLLYCLHLIMNFEGKSDHDGAVGMCMIEGGCRFEAISTPMSKGTVGIP